MRLIQEITRIVAPLPGQARSNKGLACPGISNFQSQITNNAELTAAFGIAPGGRVCVDIGVALGYFAAVVYGVTKPTTGNPGSVNGAFPTISSP